MNDRAFSTNPYDHLQLYLHEQSLLEEQKEEYQTEKESPEKEESERLEDISTGGLHIDTPQIEIETRRRLNRAISAKISPETEEQLIEERNYLVDKKFNGAGLSRKEAKKLALIRWKLDRIDDAEYGEELDRLSAFVSAQEKYSNDLHDFISKLESTGRNAIKKR